MYALLIRYPICVDPKVGANKSSHHYHLIGLAMTGSLGYAIDSRIAHVVLFTHSEAFGGRPVDGTHV